MLAWAAGFFDGEGYVTIQDRNSTLNGKRYRGFYLRVGLKHVAPEPVYVLQKLFGGTIRIERRQHNKDGCNRKDIHVWQTSCNAAKEALVQMMPYFVNKNNVAELGIDFQKTFTGKVYKVSDETHELRKMYKEEITRLNSLD
jgi:hypothetical protein